MDKDQEKETRDQEVSDTTEDHAVDSQESHPLPTEESDQEQELSPEDEVGQKDVGDLSDLFDDEEASDVFSDEPEETNSTENDSDEDSDEDSTETEPPQVPTTPNTPIAKLPIEISLEVGTHLISLEDLLELKEGATVELGETLGEELRLLVDGHCIGRAEVVKIGEKMGIRILDLIQPSKP